MVVTTHTHSGRNVRCAYVCVHIRRHARIEINQFVVLEMLEISRGSRSYPGLACRQPGGQAGGQAGRQVGRQAGRQAGRNREKQQNKEGKS